MGNHEYAIVGNEKVLQVIRNLFFKESSVCTGKVKINLRTDRCRIFNQEFDIQEVNLRKGQSCLIVKEEHDTNWKVELINWLFPFAKITGIPVDYLICSTEFRRRYYGKRFCYKTIFKDMEFFNGYRPGYNYAA